MKMRSKATEPICTTLSWLGEINHSTGWVVREFYGGAMPALYMTCAVHAVRASSMRKQANLHHKRIFTAS